MTAPPTIPKHLHHMFESTSLLRGSPDAAILAEVARLRKLLEDFSRIRIGSSRVVSRDGSVVTVSEFDSDDDARSPLYVKGVCQYVEPGSKQVAGGLVEVRWLDIVEVRN